MPDGTPRERFVIQIGGLYDHTLLDTVSIFCMQMAPGRSLSLTPDLPLDLPTLDPQVWDTDHPSIAKHHPPVHITLKDPSTIITQQQYSLTPEAHKGLKPIIDHLLQASILIPTHSPHNTPILAVKKRPNSWRLVQDLQKVDEAITPTFPVVPNPHTLLSTVPSTATHFMVLDLKDAFFTIPLHPLSQPLFAFTWQDPETHVSQQLTWTVLPQGFRDSPHFFGQDLQKDLQTLDLALSHLLQYVDDLLLCSPTQKLCLQHTAKLLGALGSWGYQVSQSTYPNRPNKRHLPGALHIPSTKNYSPR